MNEATLNRDSKSTSARPTALRRLGLFVQTVPFYPLLLAAWPVLRLYADNVAEVSPSEVVLPIVVTVGLTSAGLLVLTRLLGDASRAAVYTTLIVLPVLVFGYVSELAWQVLAHGHIQQAYAITLALWVLLVSLVVYVEKRAKVRLGSGGLTGFLNLVSSVLVLLVCGSLVGYGLRTTWAADADMASAPAITVTDEHRRSGPRRDIYHFVFDRYGSESSLRASHDIDNTAFLSWLRDRGFHIVEHAHANHERTLLSLASVLGMDLLDGLADERGRDDPALTPLIEIIRSNPAAKLLQEQGYRYVHVGSWYEPTSRSAVADEVVQPEYDVSFASTLVEQSALGGLRALASVVTTLSLDGSADQRGEATAVQLERLPGLLAQPGPKYVFAHVLLPHEPYLFTPSGAIDPEHSSYAAQLEFVNGWIRETVTPLLALPAEAQPIIILQADEGPYPSRYEVDRDAFDWSAAEDRELVAKFGVLNAMYLPGDEGAAPLPDGITLVNTYPEILNRYLGLDLRRAPDQTFAIRGGRHFDWIDITDRLDSAEIAVTPAPE